MAARRIVAIHQPNFLPWLGYFDKLARCDVFVVLDNVQLPHKTGTWINRVKMIVSGEPRWVTVPLVRAHQGYPRIDAVRIQEATDWRGQVLKSIQASYARAAFFAETFEWIAQAVGHRSDRLAEYNLADIRSLAERLGLDTSRFILGSTLPSQGHATEMLISLVKAVGGTAYLCGAGSRDYQDDLALRAAGIDVVLQDFRHPVYPQCQGGEFVAGLSTVDALMNVGFRGTAEMIRAPRVGT